VRQISVGDLATVAERWNLEHESNFYFLIFLLRMKIYIDLESLQPYPTSRSILKIYLKNRVPTILFISPLTEVVPICTVNLVIGR